MIVVQATSTFDGDIGATLQQLIYPVRDNLVNTDHVGAGSGSLVWRLEVAGDGSIKVMKPSKIPDIDI